MRVKLRKVGNSYTVTVPREIIDEMALEEGVEFDIVAREDRVVMEPAKTHLDRVMDRMRERAKAGGATEADVERAIREIRDRK